MPVPPPISVLLVDDEPHNLVALGAALASVNCRLVTAQSSRDALKCVLAEDFAVIVLDVQMPVMDGFEAAAVIRSRERSESTPIIFMTAYDPAGARGIEGYRLGAVDYLYKPFDSSVLRSKVSFFVEMFRKTVDLTAMAAELERSTEHFRALIEDSSDLTLVIAENAIIRYASPSVERILGYVREHIAGQRLFDFLHPDDVARLQSDMARLITSSAASLPTARRWRHADGSYRVLESTATNLLNTPSVAGLVVHARDVTERNQAEEEVRALHSQLERSRAAADLRRQALHDGLTGLPNRVLLYERLEQVLHDDASCALLLLDLDRFKEVNDALGHQVGDSLLQLIGARIKSAVLPTDLVARLGGDEFAVLLAQADGARAVQVAQDLVRELQIPFMMESQSIDVDASIGIAVAPQHGQDADTLLRCADNAMYQAKRSGLGVATYSRAEDQYRPDRLALVGELRHAIERNELLLHYQPKLDMRDGALAGVEALVRWQHPQRGFLAPSEFIDLAEQTGLIHALSLWVLEAALRQYQAWRALGMDIPVAVNLSRRTLQDPRLPETIARLLEQWDVPPAALVLEITESGLMADPQRAAEHLHQLRTLGVRMSIDDFGTGYSSLASLQDLSVDELKIDQSFVQAMATDDGARAIVRAVIDLADALKLRVVAEGVEDRATWDVLVGLGCDVAQGYLLSPPLAPAGLEAWVATVGPSWRAIGDATQKDSLRERIAGRGARLAAEEEFVGRTQAEAALRASEERNRLALQAAGMGTWDYDVVGDSHNWSPETEILFGLAPGTFGGTMANFLRAVHPDDWPSLDKEWQLAMAERRDFTATYRTVWPDGSWHWIEDKGRGTYAADGALVRVIGTSMDITERKQAEVALQASEKQAEQQRDAMAQSEKLRALGQMATGIAHDLNQSLMLVASYSDLARQALIQEPPNLAEVEDLITTTTQAALDGGETVKRLLLFTRAAPEQDGQPLDLNTVVAEAAHLTAPRWRDAAQAEGRPIKLHIETEGDPAIQGSPGRLREMMTNLIFNAVDALPTGGTIRLRVLAEDSLGIVEVVDSGVGMSAEVQQRVFEPFFTTKGEGGTGLGLAMVFGIVEQHGGHIELQSEPGEGTTIRMTFPLLAGSVTASPATPSATSPGPPRPLRVLVVDDEPMMTRAVARMLKPSGHVVSVAASGEEALEKLGEQTFDVVVSDMGMGAGMNGWELAEAVRRSRPDVRFMLATGWGAAIDPGEARARGVEAVLSKPYQLVDLLRALARTDAAA